MASAGFFVYSVRVIRNGCYPQAAVSMSCITVLLICLVPPRLTVAPNLRRPLPALLRSRKSVGFRALDDGGTIRKLSRFSSELSPVNTLSGQPWKEISAKLDFRKRERTLEGNFK
jgi:hypothetical protein